MGRKRGGGGGTGLGIDGLIKNSCHQTTRTSEDHISAFMTKYKQQRQMSDIMCLRRRRQTGHPCHSIIRTSKILIR